MRWGRHELERRLRGETDVLVIDQLGPLECVAGSGWANAVDVLRRGRFAVAVVVVNPLVLDELSRSLASMRPVTLEIDDGTRDLLPEHLVALAAGRAPEGRSLLTCDGPDILAADLDGTLLGPDGTPGPGVVAELARVRDAGARVILCSGRPTEYVLQKAGLLGLGEGPAIAFGGAETVALPGRACCAAPPSPPTCGRPS